MSNDTSVSGIEYTHWCPDCGSEFAIDPVYCTHCGSWETEEIGGCNVDTDTEHSPE